MALQAPLYGGLTGLQHRSGTEVQTKSLPAWPILLLFHGVLGWWALGLLSFSSVILAVPMLLMLVYRARVHVPLAALPWIGFVIWVLPSGLMLESSGQMIGWLIRQSQFIAIAVILIYVVNARRSLTPTRMLDAFTGMWASLIVGGYLGLLWPEGQLTVTVGRLLPDSIRSNEYVRDLVFPNFAEIQTPWGATEPFIRPSVPFAYTNGWGAALAILTPLVVAGVLHTRSRKRLLVLVVGGALAIAPIVASTNRGLVVAFGCAIVYVLLRQVLRRAWRSAMAISVLLACAVVTLSVAGLFEQIADRQDTVDTTDGRADLYVETFERTLLSPLLGYGAARPSFTSEVPVGTQGALWNTMFCFGFVGLALYVLFLIAVIVRTWRVPSSAGLWMHASLVAVVVMSPFYGLDRHLIVFAAIAGVLLRMPREDGLWRHRPSPSQRWTVE